METMCIEFQLIQSAMTGPRRSMALHLKAIAGTAKANHITCRNILTRKLDLNLLARKKLPQTQIWNLLKGSLNLQSRYQSSRGFAVRAEAAAGFPVLYESSETDNGGESEKMMFKSGINLSDAGKNANGFDEVRQTGGSDIEDGNNGQGSHGHGGNNGGGDTDSNSGGYGGLGGSNDGLITALLWLLFQWLPTLRVSPATRVSDKPGLFWLADKAFQLLAVNLILMSTGIMRSPSLNPSEFAVAQLLCMVSCWLASFLFEVDFAVTGTVSLFLEALVTLAAGLSGSVLSSLLRYGMKMIVTTMTIVESDSILSSLFALLPSPFLC